MEKWRPVEDEDQIHRLFSGFFIGICIITCVFISCNTYIQVMYYGCSNEIKSCYGCHCCIMSVLDNLSGLMKLKIWHCVNLYL